MPRIEGARVWGEASPRDVCVPGDGPPVDGDGCHLVPSFVDLGCDPGYPGFPAREDVASLAAAALAGGFVDLVTSPAQEPILDTPEHFADHRRDGPGGVRLWPLGAITRGLAGEQLTEVGLLAAQGVVGLSDGGRRTVDSVVLRNAFEYAAAFGMRCFLRPADPFLDALGVVHESGVAARVGLRGNPSTTEEIGLTRILALVRSTRCPVHLAPVTSARGVELVRAAKAEGLPVTASVAARSLILDEEVLLDGTYDTRFRLHPPLRSPRDRRALVDGVRDGTLWVMADHSPRAPEEKELEFERAVPGSTGLESAFAAALTALGDLDAVVRALSTGPRALLPAGPTGWALVDPSAVTFVDPTAHRSRARNDALAGRTLQGAVRATFPSVGAIASA